MNSFTCDKCLGVFAKGRKDSEAKEEFDKSPWNVPGQEIGVLCEDCFEEFKIWFSSLTEEEHKRIRGK